MRQALSCARFYSTNTRTRGTCCCKPPAYPSFPRCAAPKSTQRYPTNPFSCTTHICFLLTACLPLLPALCSSKKYQALVKKSGEAAPAPIVTLRKVRA